MSTDVVLLLVAGTSQLAMTVLATWFSLRPPKPEHHWRIIGMFLAVGLIGMGAIVWTGIRPSPLGAQVSTGFDKLEHKQDSLAQRQASGFAELKGKYDAILTRLHIPADAPLNKVLEKLEELTPHTFTIAAGKRFEVPAVTGEVVVRPRPNIQTTIKLPRHPFLGEEITVKISSGDIGLSGFVFVDGNGKKIDGRPKYFLIAAGQSCTFKFDGVEWGCT